MVYLFIYIFLINNSTTMSFCSNWQGEFRFPNKKEPHCSDHSVLKLIKTLQISQQCCKSLQGEGHSCPPFWLWNSKVSSIPTGWFARLTRNGYTKKKKKKPTSCHCFSPDHRNSTLCTRINYACAPVIGGNDVELEEVRGRRERKGSWESAREWRALY